MRQDNHSLLVIKIGGSSGLNMGRICKDVADLAAMDHRIVVVHGGSDRVNHLAESLGHPPVFLTSPSGHVSRYTDGLTRDLYVRGMCEINQALVNRFTRLGLSAIGLEGSESPLNAMRKNAIRAVFGGRTRVIRDDYTGRITSVDSARLLRLLQAGKLPVVAPVGFHGQDGCLNVDGDRAAAAIATALGADGLIILSNVPGLMRDYPNEDTLVAHVGIEDIHEALKWAQGRMKRKVLSAQEALRGGVPCIAVADGRPSQPVQRALNGNGTWFGGRP